MKIWLGRSQHQESSSSQKKTYRGTRDFICTPNTWSSDTCWGERVGGDRIKDKLHVRLWGSELQIARWWVKPTCAKALYSTYPPVIVVRSRGVPGHRNRGGAQPRVRIHPLVSLSGHYHRPHRPIRTGMLHLTCPPVTARNNLNRLNRPTTPPAHEECIPGRRRRNRKYPNTNPSGTVNGSGE